MPLKVAVRHAGMLTLLTVLHELQRTIALTFFQTSKVKLFILSTITPQQKVVLEVFQQSSSNDINTYHYRAQP